MFDIGKKRVKVVQVCFHMVGGTWTGTHSLGISAIISNTFQDESGGKSKIHCILSSNQSWIKEETR